MATAVEMRGIRKRFGNVAALKSVNLTVETGTIHAIVGENGAGKTTLVRILYGALIADEGSVHVFGNSVRFANSEEAIEAGIGMVSQHYAIIPELSCLQNLMLGAEGGALLDLHAAKTRADELAAKMGFVFDWDSPATSLSPSGAQKLEILKLLWRRSKIMILDEPTAMLSPGDSDALFESLALLVHEGATVLLVTHRLEDVLDHCAHVTVLREGRLVAELPVRQTDARALTRLIVGGDIDAPPTVPSKAPGEVALQIDGLHVFGDRGNLAVQDLDLAVRSGEILGIAGVDGNGQRELFQAILGVRQCAKGTLKLDGRDLIRQATADRLRSGMAIIPEDRHEEGLIEAWSLEENVALGSHAEAPLAVRGLIDHPTRRAWAASVSKRFGTKFSSLKQPIGTLSGGNQQRFVASRALARSPKLVLAFQPARGLDIGGTAAVYAALRQEAAKGAAILVVSFDLDELIEHCDRIVVIDQGKIQMPPEGSERDRAAIGMLMVGTH